MHHPPATDCHSQRFDSYFNHPQLAISPLEGREEEKEREVVDEEKKE
jgi:hypothetical protein